MRDKIKKAICVAAAAALAVTALAGCGGSYSTDVPGEDIFQGDVTSNGGFVVEKGNYIYFINGAEEYTASNEYGEVVKGALMRISRTDLLAGNYENVVTVVPMLFVAQNFDAGVYIYGDYVYFASPTTERDQDGNVQNDWISFKRAKLDGTEAMSDYYFRSDDNAVQYRFVEVDGVVYCLHVDDTTLYSYNTQTRTNTVLVENAGSDFFFDDSDPENPVVYYTMSVTQDMDTQNPSDVSYTQVYSVRADATVESAGIANGQASYTVAGGKTYSFNADYVQDEDNVPDFDAGDYTTYPYVNLGDLVLDGRGSSRAYTDTKFTDDDPTKAATPNGYTYTIQSYQNGGLYYTRAGVSDTSSDGESSALYYLADEISGAEGWQSIQGQAASAGNVDTVALNTTNASSSAIFLVDEENGERVHTYLYTSDSRIFRATAGEDGVPETQIIVPSASSVTLWKVQGDYLYYYATGTNGNNLTRVDYTGTADDYNPIYGLIGSEDYVPATILDVDWNSSWYTPEIVENVLFFSNAQSFGSTSYNYIYVVDLNGSGEDGMMTGEELKEFNDKYDEITEYIDEFGNNDNTDLMNALDYYFRTGETAYFEDILTEAKEQGYGDHYLYSAYAIEEFRAFTRHRESTNASANDYTDMFRDDQGNYYDVESYFMNMIGEVKESDAEAIEDAWRTSSILTLPEEEDTGWATWQKVLLGVGIAAAVVIVAGGIALFFVIRARKRRKAEELAIVEAGRKKPVIDTTDDKSIDVYAIDEPETAENAEAAEKAEEAEETVENAETAEEPASGETGEAEEPAEAPEEGAAENSAETDKKDE